MGSVVNRVDGTFFGNEVESVDVIHVTIAVIVLAVTWNLSLIHPDVCLEVIVVALDSAVDNCYNHIIRAENAIFIPGILETYVNSLTEIEAAVIPVMPLF